MLYAVLFLGEAGVVDLEVLIWFLLCAFSVESVLLTLRHDFDPFLGDLFSVEPVLLALRCKILTLRCASSGRVDVVDSEAPMLCCVLHDEADLVGLETRF